MHYTNLGSTGLKVSRICLGMMTYGTPKWRPWVLDEDASRPFVKRALGQLHGLVANDLEQFGNVNFVVLFRVERRSGRSFGCL